MELTEAAQRLKRHWLMIVVCVGVIMSIPLVMSSSRAETYVASTRMNIGSDASNAGQAEAWADAALAVVTSPSQVAAALDQIKVERDPEHVAENQVDVKSAGVSGVLVLTVTDRDPDVATALANVLSESFLNSRRAQVIDPIEQDLAQLDAQLLAAEEAIDAIEAETPGDDDVLDTRQLRLTEALTNRSDLRARQQALTADLLAAQKPSLVDPATRPSEPEPSRLVTDLVVAALLGLVVGVTLASVLETLRPTIVGSNALANVLGAPVLGKFPMRKRSRNVGVPNPAEPEVDAGETLLARHLGLAASAAGVDLVLLAGVGNSDHLEQLAVRLQVGAPQLTVRVVGSYSEPSRPASSATAQGNGGSPSTIDGKAWPIDRSSRPPLVLLKEPMQGLVVVAPEVLARGELSEVEHLLAITHWPLLGIISIPDRGSRWTRPFKRWVNRWKAHPIRQELTTAATAEMTTSERDRFGHRVADARVSKGGPPRPSRRSAQPSGAAKPTEPSLAKPVERS